MTRPSEPYSDDFISVIEDLDPEDRGGSGGLRLDLLLGIPLILAVVLFAGWQWWRQDYTASQYRAGLEATGRNDWESAIHYFVEASGYNDADAQAKGAREKIEERDRLYNAIVSNSTTEEWLWVLRDIRQIARIQPDYRDLGQREQSTLDHIYNGILSGTITLRTNASPAGLYYRTAKSWVYLRGSDAYSSVRVTPGEGEVVYDAPEPFWQPPDKPAYNPDEPSNLRGRHLVRAQYREGIQFDYMELTIDPSQYTELVPSKDGLWGIHYGNGGLGYFAPQTRVVRNFYENAEFAFQPFNMDTIAYAPLPPSPSGHSIIVEVDRNSKRYLMADWNESGPQGPTENTVVNLYLVVAGSNATRIIYSHKGGGIISAQFGPTGRYVLVHSFDARNSSEGERQSIVLVDLEAARTVTRGEPVSRATTLRDAVISPTNDLTGQSELGSTFVPGGPFAGDIVLTEYRLSSTSVQLMDPGIAAMGESGIIADANAGGSALKGWVLGFDSATDLHILGFEFDSSDALTSTLDTVTMAIDGTVDIRSFVAPGTSYPMSSKSSPHGFAWASFKYVQNVIPNENNVYIAVYSVPSTEFIGGVIRPTESYRLGLQHTQLSYPILTPSILLGDRFFAYTYDNKLHLRSYDGNDDLVLESGVQSIVEQIQSRAPWTYVR